MTTTQNLENVPVEKAIEIIFSDTPYEISHLTVNNIHHTEDIFWFITKLLRGGILYLFRSENGEVDLDAMTDSDFEKVNQHMHKIGIDVKVHVLHVPEEERSKTLQHDKYFAFDTNDELNVGMSYAIVDNDKSKLENHVLILYTKRKRIIMGYCYI